MIIIAHRGLHHEHGENSLKALHAAWLAGITWCEVDVRGSREREPFLMHDELLDRTTSGVGLIEDTPAAVLNKLAVPALKEVIASMPAEARLLVEIKPKVHPEVIDRTLALCDPAKCIVQSFDVEVLRHAAAQRQDLQLHLLVDDAKKIEGGPWDGVNVNFRTLDAATVKSIRNFGFRVGAWTVNEAVDIERIAALNVQMLITDEPLLARDICDKIG